MRIIKNFALNSNFSINCMALSNDSKFIAFGDANKIITIFEFNQIDMVIKRCVNPFNSEIINREKFLIYPEGGNLNKMTLDYHNDSVNAILFSKLNKHFLVSGASDKKIIIWKIKEETFSNEKFRILSTQSDVTDLSITPNDEYIFASCVDNNIYIWRSNFLNNTFELVKCVNNIHNNFITSIILDPNLDKINHSEFNNYILTNGMKMASYSDEGKLVLFEIMPISQEFTTKIIREFNEFINVKNKINSIQKKIDWSHDGNWIVSVNHHYIKDHKVVHARLVDLNDLNNYQVLIGHESAVLVAKFSPSKYSTTDGHNFSLLATSDKNGNLIIWKIENSQFKILTEISNFSESNITSLLWSNDGNYLFASNSNGSVYILEFNDFFKSFNNNYQNNESSNKINLSSNITSNINITKKRIAPEMINLNNNINDNVEMKNNIPLNNVTNPNSQIQECLRCKQKLDNLESKIIHMKLESFEEYNLYFQWENKVYDNLCNIQLKTKNNQILYSNRFNNKLIRLFNCNNYFYVFYDTQNHLNIFTILNTTIFYNLYVEDVTFMEIYKNFLLFITKENKITLIDVNKKEKVFESLLNINASNNSPVTTKISQIKFLDLDRIILYTDSYNIFKNTNVNNILVYNRNLSVLTQLDNNTEIENIIANCLQEQKLNKSQYNYIFDDPKFFNMLQEFNIIQDESENNLNNIRINDELKCLEDKILFYNIMNQKNEFIYYIKKLLNLFVKNKMFYRLMDFFVFNFKFNEKKIFFILNDKSQEVISDIISEIIIDSENISQEVKEFISTVTSESSV